MGPDFGQADGVEWGAEDGGPIEGALEGFERVGQENGGLHRHADGELQGVERDLRHAFGGGALLGDIGDGEFELVGIGGFRQAFIDQRADLFKGLLGQGFCLAQDGHILFGGEGGGIGFAGGASGVGHGAGFRRFHGTGVGPGGLNAHEIARAEDQLGGGDAGRHRLFRTELEFLNGIGVGGWRVEGHPCRLSDAAEEGGQVVREAEHVAAGDLCRDVDVAVVFH